MKYEMKNLKSDKQLKINDRSRESSIKMGSVQMYQFVGASAT